MDQPILDKFNTFLRSGGKVIQIGDAPVRNVEGHAWKPFRPIQRIAALDKSQAWLKDLLPLLINLKGVDGQLDGLWTCHRGKQVLLFNSTDRPIETKIEGHSIKLAPYTIWFNQPSLPTNIPSSN